VIAPLGEAQDTRTDFPLQVEHWSEPRVAALRHQEGLDQVVAGATGEIDGFRRLMHWARSQFPVGDPEPYPPSNGVGLLAEIRGGRTGGFCGQYSYLLADALKSFGHWSVRFVELENEAGDGHFAVEVWSTEAGRWVLLDPTYDVLYTGPDGAPLSALDLHAALLADRDSEVTAVEGSPPPKDGKRVADLPRRGLEQYRRLAVSLRSDNARLDTPPTLADRERTFLRWDGPRPDGSPDDGLRFRHLNFTLGGARVSDFYPPVGQVHCLVDGMKDGVATVRFETRGTWPHFIGYQVRIDGGVWRRTAATVEWTIPQDGTMHRLEVAAVNAAGLAGPVFGLTARRG